MNEVNLFVAFVAGLASFLAPCVVPLVPAYVSFISGVSVNKLLNPQDVRFRTQILVNSLIYILGFSLVFVMLGLSATALGKSLIVNRVNLLRIGGVFVTLFGLYTLGIFKFLKFSQKEFKINLPPNLQRIRFLGPFLIGVTFALAWTPCIGPILGAILTLAAAAGSIQQGALLLFIYSLGISLPFLLIALTLGSSYKLLSKIGFRLHLINLLAGILLVVVGILMFTQNYDKFSGTILNKLNSIEAYRNLQNSF